MDTEIWGQLAGRQLLEGRPIWSVRIAVGPGSAGFESLLEFGEAFASDDPSRASVALARLVDTATPGSGATSLGVAIDLVLSIRPGTRLAAWQHHEHLLAPGTLHRLNATFEATELRELLSDYVLRSVLRYLDPDENPEDRDGRFARSLNLAEATFPVPEEVCLTEAVVRLLEGVSVGYWPWPPSALRAAERQVHRFGVERLEERARDLAELRGGRRLGAFRKLAVFLSTPSPGPD